MDSLYELCLEWSKLAPKECCVDGQGSADGICFGLTNDPHYYYTITPSFQPDEQAVLLSSVCHWLKERRLDYVLEGYGATSLLTDEPFYGYKALLPVGNHGWGMTAQPTPAHALLGAYVEYLKAQQ